MNNTRAATTFAAFFLRRTGGFERVSIMRLKCKCNIDKLSRVNPAGPLAAKGLAHTGSCKSKQI